MKKEAKRKKWKSKNDNGITEENIIHEGTHVMKTQEEKRE